jgi:hypothetical protein
VHITAFSASSAQDLVQQLGGAVPDFLSVHTNADLAVDGLAKIGCKALHGGTSCLGAMTNRGLTSGLAAFAITDADGAYGTARAAYDDTPHDAARAATQQALSNADRLGERPELVWVSTTPGHEEDILNGIQSVIGPDVPIIGGSAADNTVAGHWFVFDQTGQSASGVVVSVLFPSSPVSFAYQNGYAPTQNAGIVTKVENRRLVEIDNRPAAQVFAEWTGGDVPFDATDGPQTILSASTIWPFGRQVNTVGDVPFYLLAHAATAHSDGALDLFATVELGETLTQMNGTITSLTERAGRVAALARAAGHMDRAPIKGALMIYCGGCMLTVRDAMPDVVTGVDAALDQAPFVGAFTFGEQGRLVGAGNRHGNLMISCIVFG